MSKLTTAPRARSLGWRALAAAAVLASAVLHLVMYVEWAQNILPLGAAFLAQGVVGVVLAVLLVTWRSPLVVWAAVAYGAGSVAAFFLSSATGFLGVRAQLVGWQEWVSKGVELLAVLAALVAAALERRRG